ncbi:MAG: lipid-A-disaccharide synthase [Caedimonas sp.]|nr:lipid-A-disaccharide synthase [Caedimonas sp.]
MSRAVHLYLIAGEASGDQVGARLMQALRTKAHVRFSGIGGPCMESQGLRSLFPMSDLSVMGIFEVLPHIPRLLKRLQETERDILEQRPDVVVTIDAPGFNFRLAKRLKKQGIPIIHYTAPTVWAWRPGRARKVARFLSHLLTLFPFEPPYFEKEGLPTTFVGHPLVEMDIGPQRKKSFRQRFGYAQTQPLLCLLPGSRQKEVDSLLPLFLNAVDILKSRLPDLEILLPVVPHLESAVCAHLKESSLSSFRIISDPQEKIAAMAASDVALAASGTVALELALTETPMVIAYKMNPLTAWVVRRLLLTRYACLVNILLNESIVPELLQENCTVGKIVESVLVEMQGSQREHLKKIRPLISPVSGTPSDIAAAQILKVKDIKI